MNPPPRPVQEVPVRPPFGVPFIRWANYAPYKDGAALQPRRIYDHEFVYVMSGNGSVVIEGVSYPAPADTLFLVLPRQWHSFRSDCGEDWLLMGVHFDWREQEDTPRFQRFSPATPPVDESRFRKPLTPRGWPRDRPYLDLRGRPRVRRTLEDLVAEYGRADAEARTVAGCLLTAAIGQIEREIRLLAELEANLEIGPDAVRRVQRARELLESPRDRPITIEEAASTVGWSADHLRRLCRAVLNVTPHEIQTAARIRRAQELLRYGGLSIREIALRCGFDDASHFSRVFKKATTYSPRDWQVLRANSLPEKKVLKGQGTKFRVLQSDTGKP